MAGKDKQTQLFHQLIKQLQPEMQRALLQAWEEIRSGIDWTALKDALARADMTAAIDALNIEPAAFSAYQQAATSAYLQGGNSAVTTVNAPKGSTVTIRFDMTNPRAEAWIAENVGQKIVGLVEGAKEVARATILTGYQAGRHPDRIALDLGGRVVAGRRQGGVIDLDGPRADRLLAVSRGMETPEGARDLVVVKDGVPTVRYKVNPATKARILRAYEKGTAVPPADRVMSVQQYRNALVKARTETVALKETASAVMSARKEAWVQALEKLGAPASAVIKTWSHGGGVKEPRWWHIAANNKQVRGLDTPFELANGATIDFAHDPAAPLSETAGCTCNTSFRLDATWNLT